ncbi:MAG: sigma-70 family RNA polymerase sigma factor [Vicinamibacterales bacterium]
MSTRAEAWPADGTKPDWTLRVAASNQDESGRELPLVEVDDRHLVELCLGGRIEAFDFIVERHQRAVYQLCFRFVRRHEDAADLTQEVFLRAYRGLRRFRGDSALGTWLYRIGVNVCLNHASARRTPETSLDDAPQIAAAGDDPASSLVRAERGARVRAAVARLPRKQRAALVLRVYQDLSHGEIASVLGTTVGAVKANVFHALGNLKKLLAEEAAGKS